MVSLQVWNLSSRFKCHLYYRWFPLGDRCIRFDWARFVLLIADSTPIDLQGTICAVFVIAVHIGPVVAFAVAPDLLDDGALITVAPSYL